MSKQKGMKHLGTAIIEEVLRTTERRR